MLRSGTVGRALAAALVAAAIVGPAVALAGDAPNEAQLLESLRKKSTRGTSAAAGQDAMPAEVTKLIEDLKAKSTRGMSVSTKERETLAAVTKDLPQVDLEVTFDYNSSAISPRARPTLMSLGRTLVKLDAKGGAFIVAGHTDGKGKPSYNQALSERRAQAVKDFLVEKFDLRDGDLVVVGYGQEQPKNASEPNASENRRVQVVNATTTVSSADH